MGKESEERPNDPISLRGLEALMSELAGAQEEVRTKNEGNKYARGGKLGREYGGPGDLPNQLLLDKPVDMQDFSWMDELEAPIDASTSKDKNSSAPTWMRYIPAFASGVMSITDALGWTNKPDYGDAEALLEASRGAGTYQPVRFKPVGNYLTYRPFDRDFYINKMNAEAGATRRSLLNTSGGNRATAMAGLLAADNNYLNQIGGLARQAEEYNLAQRAQVEEFNRGTNTTNSQGFLQADMANQKALMESRESSLKGIMAATEMRQRERQSSTAARSANLSNFINSLGDIGRENFSRNMIISDPSKYYTIGANGEVSYKSSYYDLTPDQQDQVDGHATRHSKRKSNGGFLTMKKRRR